MLPCFGDVCVMDLDLSLIKAVFFYFLEVSVCWMALFLGKESIQFVCAEGGDRNNSNPEGKDTPVFSIRHSVGVGYISD